MKKDIRAIVAVGVGLLIYSLFPGKVFSNVITNVPPDISSKEIKAVVVEDFEGSPTWQILTTPKKFTKSDESSTKTKDPVPLLQVKIVDGAPSDLKVEQWTSDKKGMSKNKVLGVNFQFRYPGFNSIQMIPPEPIRLPGRSQGISLWVHGRGNNYNLEVWVKDYEGSTHILKFGSVNFVGWKPMMVEIPRYIPQEVNTYPQTKTLVIERFVLRADPTEVPTNTFFFFDQVKVLTETYEVNFDGMGLEEAFQKDSSSGGPAPADKAPASPGGK